MDVQNASTEQTRTSVAVLYNKMRYVMAFLGFMAVTLAYTFKNLRSIYSFGPPTPFFLEELVETMALLQFTIPVAMIAERFSLKGMMCVAFTTNTCALLLSPETVGGVVAIFYWKAVHGFTEATYYSVFHLLVARWAPPKERTLMSSIIWSGIPMGELIASQSGIYTFSSNSGLIVFICIFASLWIGAWIIFVENTPEIPGRFASRSERLYILESQNKRELSTPTPAYPPFPFKAVISSKPLWAILLCHLCIECTLTILKDIPSHVSPPLNPGILGYFQEVNLSWAPKLLQWFFTIFIGFAMMMMVKSDKVDLTTARKIATTFAIIPALMPLLIMYVEEPVFLFFLYTTGKMFSGAIYSGYMINHIDLAPRFAATLLATTMTVVIFAREILKCVFIYHTLRKQHFNETYGLSLMTGLGLFTVNAVLCYWIFGSAEEQSWNTDKASQGEIKKNKNEYSETPYPDHV